jgi:alkanesulfonate monooxygenase SsuD/methylene tetrahydromethanopterin reductase-like flavin-dependent oxidoreductase (luciferase family)
VLVEIENYGYYSINLIDHLSDNILEGWMLLPVLGAISNNIRLGHTVLCNSLRNPALLANMAASLDIISRGRLELGLGAGWAKRDYDTLGISYPKSGIRISQLQEAVIIIKKTWTEDKPS